MSSNYKAKSYEADDTDSMINSNQKYIRATNSFENQYIRPMDNFQKISSEMVNPYTCAIDGFFQGYTLNHLDETLSTIPAMYGAYRGFENGDIIDSTTDYYNRSKNMFRDHLKNCYYQEPWRTTSAEILGAFASPLKLKVLGPAAIPAIGAISGFGAAEGSFNDQATNTLAGIGGAVLGNWVGNTGMNYISKNSNRIANAVSESLYPVTNQNYSPQIARSLTQFSESPVATDLTSGILDNTLQKYINNIVED